jgi:hypothetical protein
MKCGQVNKERGIGRTGRKRDREEQISGERDGALEGFRNGMGCKFDR